MPHQEQWNHIMGTILVDTWVLYLFGDSSDHIDKNRLAYLYKAQTSLYADVKADAIIRIITNVDPRSQIGDISFEKIDEVGANAFFIQRAYFMFNNIIL